MKRVFSSTCVFFVLVVVASTLRSNAIAKPTVVSRAASPSRFLGLWSDNAGFFNEDLGINHPKFQRYTLFQFLPSGRLRLTDVSRGRKSQSRGTYRIEGDNVITTHTIKNLRFSILRKKNTAYTGIVRTQFRLSGANNLSGYRTVTRYVDSRNKSVERIEQRSGKMLWRIKPPPPHFQFL